MTATAPAPRPTLRDQAEAELRRRLADASNQGLLTSLHALTHQVHAAPTEHGKATARRKRLIVEAEVLRRMGDSL